MGLTYSETVLTASQSRSHPDASWPVRYIHCCAKLVAVLSIKLGLQNHV